GATYRRKHAFACTEYGSVIDVTMRGLQAIRPRILPFCSMMSDFLRSTRSEWEAPSTSLRPPRVFLLGSPCDCFRRKSFAVCDLQTRIICSTSRPSPLWPIHWCADCIEQP